MIIEEYCPNCNAYLKRQKGFNSNLKYFLKGRMIGKELLAESLDENDELDKEAEDRDI